MRLRHFLLPLACCAAPGPYAQTGPFEEDSATVLVAFEAHSMSAFWGDYDADGDLDLLVATTLEDDMLFRNELLGDEPQQGVFTAFTLNTLNLPPGSVNGGGWVDLDRDGDLDIATTSIFGAALLRNVGEGDVPFELMPSILDNVADVRDLIPGDFDLDGDADLVLLRRFDAGNALLRNEGSGAFTVHDSPVSTAFDDVATGCWGHLNQDLYPELFVANVTPDDNRFYLNLEGELADTPTAAPADDATGSQSCAWGDYDGDGDFDLFVGKERSYSGIPDPGPLRNKLYRNDDGVLVLVDAEPVTTDLHRTIGSAWGDVDNDGDLDLVVSNHDAPEILYLNTADGFTAVQLTGNGDGRSMGVSLVDDDGDGDLDLYVANGGPRTDLPVERNRYFRNTTSEDTSRHWVQFDLRGVQSDLFGVGALVRVFVTEDSVARSYVRAVQSRPWRLAQDGFRVHVGLGAATWIDSVQVDWPIAGRRTVEGMRVDTIHVIPEEPEIVGSGPDPDASPLSLRAHPNPSRGAVTLVASGLPVGPARIDVYDIVGRRVARLDATATAGVARFSFPPGMRLRAGAYAARMVDGSASVMFTVW